MNLDVYVVTDRGMTKGRPLLWVVEESLAAGAGAIQLREKEIATRDFVELAFRIKEIAGRYGALFIVNDRVDVALAVAADGVHLGQEDMPPPLARQLLGPRAVIGLSVATVQEAQKAVADGADYLGVSAVFSTPTKIEAEPVGLEGLKQIRQAVGLPLVGIGGIHAGNSAEVIGAGADGVAVVSTVMAADSPSQAVKALLAEVHRAKISVGRKGGRGAPCS